MQSVRAARMDDVNDMSLLAYCIFQQASSHSLKTETISMTHSQEYHTQGLNGAEVRRSTSAVKIYQIHLNSGY